MVNKMKKILTVMLVSMVTIVLTSCTPKLTDIDDYETYINEIYGADEFMPNLKDLPSYENVDVYYYDRSSKSITLSIKFSSENYEDAKETILNQHSFLDGPLQDDTGFYYIPKPEFSYSGYQIKVVEDEDFSYPEKFGMIGYSDDYNRICFLFFYDRSLNELGSGYEMDEFAEDHFMFLED